MAQLDWCERRDLPWAKVYAEWFSSPSHVDLDATTLGIGVRAMQIANQRGRRADGSGALLNGAGLPLSVSALAREAHATEEQAARALAELVAVGTLAIEGGDLYVFPNLRAHQEDPSTERKRRARRDCARDSDQEPGVNDGVKFTRRGSEDQKIRGSEDQRGEEAPPPAAPVPPLVEPTNEPRVEARAHLLATPLEAEDFRAAWNARRGRLPEEPPFGRGTLTLFRQALARDHARHDPAWWGALAERASRAAWLVETKQGLLFFLHRFEGEVRLELLARGEYDEVRRPKASGGREDATTPTARAAQASGAVFAAKAHALAAERATAAPVAVADILARETDPGAQKFLRALRGGRAEGGSR